MYKMALSIKEGPAFAALQSDFDMLLKSTLRELIAKEQVDAEVNIKLKIAFPDKEKAPTFSHKVTSVIKLTEEKQGFLSTKDYAMVYDSVIGAFTLVKIQPGLFEGEN